MPSGGKPLSALFQKLGVNPIELLEGHPGRRQGLGLEGILNEAIGGAGAERRSTGAGIEQGADRRMRQGGDQRRRVCRNASKRPKLGLS